MSLKVHIICAKCGSDKMHFEIEKPIYSEDGETGVSIVCENCGELTGVDEWNEFNGRVKYNPTYKPKKESIPTSPKRKPITDISKMTKKNCLK